MRCCVCARILSTTAVSHCRRAGVEAVYFMVAAASVEHHHLTLEEDVDRLDASLAREQEGSCAAVGGCPSRLPLGRHV
jgi:hypothetical protein